MTRPGSDDAGRPHTALGPGHEFAAIGELLAQWGAAASGVGDDCAVLDVPAGERLCVSTDTSTEDVHFRRRWLTPAEIGFRATTAALSDLAAMAARPLALLVAITLPPAWRLLLGGIADGIGEAAARAGAPIVGGDTTGGTRLSLTVTVLGSAAEPVMRSGARAGDRVYVTGALGAPLAALRALERGEAPDAAHRERFVRPAARLREARWLAERGVRAMIDVSDGLAQDLAHLAAASRLRVVVDAERVPAVDGVSARDAVASGEEYELALTAPALDARAFAAEFGIALTEIGRVEAGEPGVELRAGGVRVDLPRGYDHFSR